VVQQPAVSKTLRHPWLVVTAVAAVLAAWMGLGSLHQFQHADSLLTVLISTQRWTPFFWGQDRFGMLVPLVAMPIHHPLANLLAQGWMMTVAALLAPFVVARFLTGRGGEWLAIGAGANLLLLLVATPEVQFDWLVTQPYALSVSLGFGGLIVADDRGGLDGIATSLVLLVLACWVNIGVIVMLAIAASIRGRRRARLLALETAAAAVASLAARFLASAHTVTALAPLRQWADGWRQLLAGTPAMTASPAAAIGIVAGAAAAIAWLWKAGGLPPRRTLAAILAMALGTWLFVGTSLWVGMNRYSFRYMYPTMMIVGVGASTVFAALFAKRWKERSAVAALSALAAVAVVSYGAPSPDRISRGFDDRFGRQTAAVLHSGATVIGGDYWRVWPAVFHANLALARAHASAQMFGLAYRSEETDPLWKSAGRQILIASWPDDRSVGAVAGEHGIAVTPLAHLPEIDLYTGQP
jgi:hypothetical protein